MKEPYRTLYSYLVVGEQWRRGEWKYNVKWTGNAFYIGTDDEHITILEDSTGFHHSFNEHGSHVTRKQHEVATISMIVLHIESNPRAYWEPKLLSAMKYIQQNQYKTI